MSNPNLPSVLFSCVSWFVLLTVVGVAGAGENLVAGPSFEQPKPDGSRLPIRGDVMSRIRVVLPVSVPDVSHGSL